MRDGERVPLSAKSLDTLLALVTRYAETVSKSELMEAVWGATVVEENSFNKCSEVRKALGDTRGQHDYIVTMTGVGYRFVASVTVGQPGAEGRPRGHSGLKTTLRFWGPLAALVLLTGLIAIYVIHSATAPQRRLAVILPLKNLPATSDTAWPSTAIDEMLYHELAGVPGALHLVPPEDAARMDHDLPHGNPREIRNYSGADIALAGTVTVLSGEAEKPLRIDLRVQDLRSGDVIATKSLAATIQMLFVRSQSQPITRPEPKIPRGVINTVHPSGTPSRCRIPARAYGMCQMAQTIEQITTALRLPVRSMRWGSSHARH